MQLQSVLSLPDSFGDISLSHPQLTQHGEPDSLQNPISVVAARTKSGPYMCLSSGKLPSGNEGGRQPDTRLQAGPPLVLRLRQSPSATETADRGRMLPTDQKNPPKRGQSVNVDVTADGFGDRDGLPGVAERDLVMLQTGRHLRTGKQHVRRGQPITGAYAQLLRSVQLFKCLA